MQKHIHIKALLFLGIFGMLLMHQVVPHLHHQHEDSHSHIAIVNNDDHHHHHDVPEKDDSSKKGFIDLFLEMHLHSTVANDNVVVLKETKTTQTVAKKDIKQTFSPNHNIVYNDYGDVEKPLIYQPTNNHLNPYFTHLDLRGPPTLG